MIITLAMLWDNLNQTYPELETELYTNSPVRGIKLLPPTDERLSEEILYLGRQENGIDLIYNGKRSFVGWESHILLEEMFNALQDSYNRLRDWDMEMHLSLLEGCGAEKLLELSESILGNPVTVMDPSFKLLARSSHAESPSAIYNEVCRNGYLSAEMVKLYFARGYLNDLVSSGKDGAFQIERGFITITRALKYQRRLIGYLTMPCTQSPYSEGLAACFACLGDGIAQCMSRELQSHTLNRYMYEYFLADLLEGRNLEPPHLQERLNYIGLPWEGKFRLLELEWTEGDHLLDHYLSQQVAELIPNEKVFVYGKSVLVFIQDEQRLDWVLERLGSFLKQRQGRCGVSRRFSRLTDIRKAYQQTAAALRLGCRVSTLRTLYQLGVETCHYDESIFHYDRYAPYHMVEAAADAGLYSPLLDELIERDLREHNDNLRVLYGYLLCERRPTVAATYLHMHRNNVIYRVGRIESMLSISLEDAHIRRELEASLMVLELIKTGYEADAGRT